MDLTEPPLGDFARWGCCSWAIGVLLTSEGVVDVSYGGGDNGSSVNGVGVCCGDAGRGGRGDMARGTGGGWVNSVGILFRRKMFRGLNDDVTLDNDTLDSFNLVLENIPDWG